MLWLDLLDRVLKAFAKEKQNLCRSLRGRRVSGAGVCLQPVGSQVLATVGDEFTVTWLPDGRRANFFTRRPLTHSSNLGLQLPGLACAVWSPPDYGLARLKR